MTRTHKTDRSQFSQIFVLIFGCFFLTSWGAFSPALAQVDLPNLIKKAQSSSVVIQTYTEQGDRLGQGTGFFIAKNGDLITNYHVLHRAGRSKVKLLNGEEYEVKRVVAEDPDGDLVRVAVDIPEEKVDPLPVSSTLPRVGEKVVVIGTPLGLDQTVSDGIVSAIREVPGFGRILQMTAPYPPVRAEVPF